MSKIASQSDAWGAVTEPFPCCARFECRACDLLLLSAAGQMHSLSLTLQASFTAANTKATHRTARRFPHPPPPRYFPLRLPTAAECGSTLPTLKIIHAQPNMTTQFYLSQLRGWSAILYDT